jgi:hypothetical protein
MIRLFCRPGACLNDLLSAVVSVFDRGVRVLRPHGDQGVHAMADSGGIAAVIETSRHYDSGSAKARRDVRSTAAFLPLGRTRG